MHQGASGGTATAVTQAEADACCAASDQDDSTPSRAVFVPVTALGPVASPVALVSPPPRAQIDGWRLVVPRAAGGVPTHVLLSVFLI